MNTTDVIERVGRAKSSRDLKPLVEELRGVPDPILFAALFPIAVREQGEASGPVAMSAYSLYALNPVCPLHVDAAVGSLLASWDVSIEEVVWYLANQFGRGEVLASVARLRMQQSDAMALKVLDTIEYWITGVDRMS